MLRAWLLCISVGLVALGCGSDKASEPQPGELNPPPAERRLRFAFVPNNVSNFWTIAKKGLDKAAAELDVEAEFRPPASGGIAEQRSIIEDLLNKGIDGITVSPIDPANQTDFLNGVADRVPLLCHDSDAPQSKRLAYVGTNNLQAGREAGKLIKEALPQGGKIMLFVGTLDAQNAQDRKRGIEEELQGSGVDILDTRTDQVDTVKARSIAEDELVAHPDLACLVGLWSYNGPALAAALKGSGKAGSVKIVCFDEDEETLQAITEGLIHGTVVQRPFEMGYQTIKLLTDIARGNKGAVPEGGLIDTGVVLVRKDNVQAFWDELKALTQ
ncbi:MAG: sugar-binding protein [Candidatus Omnitrophica bacterium]|nr:sugar-binding protein [Candidatus Omnitrophota bacterium]